MISENAVKLFQGFKLNDCLSLKKKNVTAAKVSKNLKLPLR